MSVAEQIARIQGDKSAIRTKLQALGLAQPTDGLDELAAAVEGIVDRGGVQAQVKEGETYTVPKGYHDGTGTVSGVSGGGNYQLQSKSVTPSRSQQQVTPDAGYYGLSDVTVAAIPASLQDVSTVTAGAADVLSGKVIVDAAGKQVAGTMPDNGAVSKVLTADEASYTVPKGYHGGAGEVSVSLEQKSVSPTKAQQVVEPTAGKLLSQVAVAAIPAEYVSTEDATATAAQILAGKTAYAGGSKVTGTMPDNGAIAGEIDGMAATSYAVPAGYTSGGSVTLTGSIEAALAEI